jgi:hypothetical protein
MLSNKAGLHHMQQKRKKFGLKMLLSFLLLLALTQ